MTDLVLIAAELEKQCKLRRLRIISLDKHALGIELFAENIGCKIGCDERKFQVTCVSRVIVDDIINAVIG